VVLEYKDININIDTDVNANMNRYGLFIPYLILSILKMIYKNFRKSKTKRKINQIKPKVDQSSLKSLDCINF